MPVGLPGAAAVPGLMPGRSAAPGYRRAGGALLLYGVLAAVWIVRGLSKGSMGVGDFLASVFDSYAFFEHVEREARLPAGTYPQNAYDWAFTVALLIVGGLALSARRGSRGAVLAAAGVLFFLSLRELIGVAVSGDYLDRMTDGTAATLLLLFRVLGLLVAVLAIVEMVRVGRIDERQEHQEQPQFAPGFPPSPFPMPTAVLAPGSVGAHARPMYLVAGFFMLVHGLALLGWQVRYLTRSQPGSSAGQNPELGGYLRGVFDASAGQVGFYLQDAFMVALLLLAVLALAGRRVARGGALLLGGIYLYDSVRNLVPIVGEYGIENYFRSLEGVLSILTTIVGLVSSLVVLIAMLRAPDRGRGSAPGHWQDLTIR
jgi:hypothetical protein